MGVKPVARNTMACGEPDVALVHLFHLLDDDALHGVEFVGLDVKVEFIVYLENHLGADALVGKTAVDAHHGELDDVGCGTLDGRVDGIALAETPHHGIPRVDVGQHAAASVQGSDITLLSRLGDAAVDVFAHLREGGVVAVDEHLGLVACNVQPLRQPEGTDAVQDAEVGGFGLAALVTGDLVQRLVINARGGDGVDVVVVGKGVKHRLVMAQVGDQPQLDLGVVGTEEHVALGGDKGAADFLAVIGAHGNVLQVGIGRGQSACGGDRLVVGRVDAPR